MNSKSKQNPSEKTPNKHDCSKSKPANSPAISDPAILNILSDINKSIQISNDTMNKRFSELENKIDSFIPRLEHVEKTTKDLEHSATHTSAEVTSLHKQIDSLLAKDTLREKDNQILENDVKRLRGELRAIRIETNQNAQFQRNALVCVVGGIPMQESEDLDTKIQSITTNANFDNFNINQIDVLHRVPTRNTENKNPPPVVIRFKTKFARNNFVYQKKKLKKKSLHQLGVAETRRQLEVVDDEISFGGGRKQPYIYITDSLTPYNGQLLADAKKIAKELDYEFIGYTNNKGEVRVKKSEDCDPISILCRQDLAKII